MHSTEFHLNNIILSCVKSIYIYLFKKIYIKIILYFQDQKILELMLTKREQEVQSCRAREQASLAWEQERVHEQRTRANSESRRRNLLTQQRLAQEKLKVEELSRNAQILKTRYTLTLNTDICCMSGTTSILND